MKTGIVIITFNLDSRILILQVEAIRKLCKDTDYTIEIFDNSTDPELAEGLRYHSSIMGGGINYRKTMSATGNHSDSHSFAANLSYNILQDTYDFFAYLDHDLIPVKPFSVSEILGDKRMAGIGQSPKADKKYFWPGCLFWNNKLVIKSRIDFSTNHEYGLDTGGNLYQTIELFGESEFIFFNEKYCQNPGFTDSRYGHYSMINDDMFMHFVNSSNWNPVEGNKERISSLINIAAEKVNSWPAS